MQAEVPYLASELHYIQEMLIEAPTLPLVLVEGSQIILCFTIGTCRLQDDNRIAIYMFPDI